MKGLIYMTREMNLSEEVMDTVMNALRCSKQTLKKQLKTAETKQDQNKVEIIRHQLDDVQYALDVFEGYGW